MLKPHPPFVSQHGATSHETTIPSAQQYSDYRNTSKVLIYFTSRSVIRGVRTVAAKQVSQCLLWTETEEHVGPQKFPITPEKVDRFVACSFLRK